MKCILLLFALCLCWFSTMAQVTFDPGYIISNDGKRTDCQIRNVDWKNNPGKFDYRLGETGETIQGTVDNILEFGVNGGGTFRKFAVQIDRSSNEVEKITVQRDPQFVSETLFLRVLVDGKGTLYMYKEDVFERFFYSVDGSDVKQLVYKRYTAKGQATVSGLETIGMMENELYKQQLYNEMKCESISMQQVERLRYVRGDLTKFFSAYNTCHGATTTTVKETGERKGKIQFNFRAGVTFHSMSVSNALVGGPVDFGTSPSYRIGIELENILPFNRGRWSLLLEPAFQGYSANTNTASVKYATLDLNVGVRRYFFLEKGKLYLNANAIYGIPLNTALVYSSTVSAVPMNPALNFALAAGYNINRISLEARYSLNHHVVTDYAFYTSKYGGPEFVVGFRLN